MKLTKIMLPLVLMATHPSGANATSEDPAPTSNGRCLFIFPTSWFGYMYLPCQATSHHKR